VFEQLLGIFRVYRRPVNAILELQPRIEVEQRLKNTPAIATSKTAAAILDAVHQVVDRVADANRNLETKANGLIVLSSAMLGFGANIANAHRVTIPWMGVLGVVALLIAIFCAACVNLVETFNLPTPIAYNLPSVANMRDNEAKIYVELAEAWNAYAVDERNAGVTKTKWLVTSFLAMLTGVTLFALVACLALLKEDQSKSALSSLPTPCPVSLSTKR
jgi:hypothetical protein